MKNNGKESLEEIDLKAGRFRGQNLGAQLKQVMTHAALCRWIPIYGLVILFAVLADFFDQPFLAFGGAGGFIVERIAGKWSGNKSP